MGLLFHKPLQESGRSVLADDYRLFKIQRDINYIFPWKIMGGIRYGAPVNQVLSVDPEKFVTAALFQLIEGLVDNKTFPVKTKQTGGLLIDVEQRDLI
jgi:hypothetical protein